LIGGLQHILKIRNNDVNLMIILMLKEDWQKDEMLYWIMEHKTATEDETLDKAIEIARSSQ